MPTLEEPPPKVATVADGAKETILEIRQHAGQPGVQPGKIAQWIEHNFGVPAILAAVLECVDSCAR